MAPENAHGLISSISRRADLVSARRMERLRLVQHAGKRPSAISLYLFYHLAGLQPVLAS
jgi:hypothetical protein